MWNAEIGQSMDWIQISLDFNIFMRIPWKDYKMMFPSHMHSNVNSVMLQKGRLVNLVKISLINEIVVEFRDFSGKFTK